jgi:hypothetical protein
MSGRSEKTKKKESTDSEKIRKLLSQLKEKQVELEAEQPLDTAEIDKRIEHAKSLAQKATQIESCVDIEAEFSDAEKREEQAKLMAERLKQKKMAV